MGENVLAERVEGFISQTLQEINSIGESVKPFARELQISVQNQKIKVLDSGDNLRFNTVGYSSNDASIINSANINDTYYTTLTSSGIANKQDLHTDLDQRVSFARAAYYNYTDKNLNYRNAMDEQVSATSKLMSAQKFLSEGYLQKAMTKVEEARSHVKFSRLAIENHERYLSSDRPMGFVIEKN
jgi:hypothetical protein